MILLLLGTGVRYSVWGELRDAVTIFAVITLLIASEVGPIAPLAGSAKPPRTPLRRSMNELSKLVGVALVLSALVPLSSVVVAGQSVRAAGLT